MDIKTKKKTVLGTEKPDGKRRVGHNPTLGC